MGENKATCVPDFQWIILDYTTHKGKRASLSHVDTMLAMLPKSYPKWLRDYRYLI